MIEKIKKYVKTAIAGVLVLSLVLQAFHGMQYVLANEETTGPATYTVTLTEAAQVFIYNEQAPNGAVTLTYTVQSAEKTCRQNGVIATTNPEADYPYQNGEGNMKHKITTTLLYSVGATYKVQMSLDAEGKVQYSAERSKPGETLTSPTLLDNDEGTGNTNATYFGIWLDLGDAQGSPETAVLTNVSCVDAAGNDLGVKVKAATGTCEAVKDEIEEPEEPIVAETYTVTLTNAAQVFICNDKAPDGAVTLTYTVQSRTKTCLQNGVIATTAPAADYPYLNGKGHMKHAITTTFLYTEGATYTIKMQLDGAGKVQYSAARTKPGETLTSPTQLGNDEGTGNTNATYFGIWIDVGTAAGSPETAVLTNVSCVDAAGNDLGVKVKAATGTCKAVKDEIEEPEEPIVAETYTVTLTNAAQVFICNDKAPNGAVTLTYTVQSASRTCYQNGAIATTDPEADYPFENGKGHMRFLNGRLWTYRVGATYQVQMSLDADGKIQYSGGRTYPDGSTDSLADKLTAETGTANKNATYFGIWLSLGGVANESPETAVLTNVSCVDAAGNDLGVKVKATTGTCEAIKHETVTLDAKYETYGALPYLLSGTGDLTVNGEAKENECTLTQVGDYEIQWDYYGRITKQKIVIYQLGNAHLDENIDVCDLVAIKKEADEHYLDTEAAMLGADVDDSKIVDDADVTKMRKVLVGTVTLDEPAAVSYALNDTSVMPIAGYYGPCG